MNLSQSLEIDKLENFIKIGKDVYSLEKIGEDGLQLENYIKEINRRILAKTIKECEEAVYKESKEEFNSQIKRIDEQKRKNNGRPCKIVLNIEHNFNNFSNATMYGIYNNRPIVIMHTQYQPNEIYIENMSRGYVKTWANNTIIEINGTQTCLGEIIAQKGSVTFTYTPPLPALDMYIYRYLDYNASDIYTSIRTLHSYSDNKFCIGSYKDYWVNNVEEMRNKINKINTASLAYDYIINTASLVCDYTDNIHLEVYLSKIDISTIKLKGGTWIID